MSLESRIKTLAAAGSAALAAGTFALYAAGYLALRIRLRILGIEPNLEVVDERYLFVGAHFFLYFLTLLPTVLLPLLPLGLAVLLARRWHPLRHRLDRLVSVLWHASPARWAAFGILWAVASVQLVMRQVFTVDNLLLGPPLCDPAWLAWLAHDQTGTAEPLFLAGLGALTLPTFFCLACVARHRSIWAALLAPLALVQLLLLPVHFGFVAAGDTVDRVAPPPEEPAGAKMWRVFATETASTFLVERPGPPPVRRLLIVPTEKLEPLEVMHRERLFTVLAAREGGTCGQ